MGAPIRTYIYAQLLGSLNKTRIYVDDHIPSYPVSKILFSNTLANSHLNCMIVVVNSIQKKRKERC